MKYIITSAGSWAIFSDMESHNFMSANMEGEPVGAGFCTIAQQADSERVNIHCFGESVSLHLKSREEDEKMLNELINE